MTGWKLLFSQQADSSKASAAGQSMSTTGFRAQTREGHTVGLKMHARTAEAQLLLQAGSDVQDMSFPTSNQRRWL